MRLKNKDSTNTILRAFYEGKVSPYYTYSQYLVNEFGEKVYKLPIHLLGTCPNRDGKSGSGGCIFCGEEGGSFEWESKGSIKEQLIFNMTKMGDKYKSRKFIAYFQNFSNTYLPLNRFKENLEQVKLPGIVGINVATRPDCLEQEYIDILAQYSEEYVVTVELGLQSANDETLQIINRGHNVSSFVDAVGRLKEKNIRVCTHMILDFPWDGEEDIIDGAKLLNSTQVDEVKIHNLYIIKNTKLFDMYRMGTFVPLELEDFIDRTILFLEYLNPNIVIGRLTGRAPQNEVQNSNWNHSWYFVRDEIIKKMLISNKKQGSKYFVS